jgi:ribulose 1,5-bisphosphate synthetase/thiazole synthase
MKMSMQRGSYYDVIVAGGGPGGLAAAVSAARQGLKVLLVERLNFLGGNLASGLPLLSFFNAQGEQVVYGFADELITRLQKRGGAGEHVLCPMHLSLITVDPEVVKYEALHLAKEAGVELLLHSAVVEPIVEDNRVAGVIVENKSGRQALYSKVVVDGTGDADLAHRAGGPCQQAEPHELQPMTLMFTMGGVDVDRLRKYILDNPEVIKPMTNSAGGDFPVEHFATAPDFIALGFDSVLAKAREEEKLESIADLNDLQYLILITSFVQGQVNVNSAKVLNYDPTSGESLTEAENEARIKVFALAEFLRNYIPGFENARVLTTAAHIGVRESRRIVGEYTLSREDLEEGVKHADDIALGCYPMDIHYGDGRPAEIIYSKSGSYGIPYRCIVPQQVENLLIAGRPISATREAFGATRVMPTCMAVGQAAGLAAFLAVRGGSSPREVDVEELRKLLEESNARLA